MPEPIPVPTLCKLEYQTPNGSWEVAHHAINLLHPRRYVERLVDHGKTGRVTLIDTGEVIQLGACSECHQVHPGPQDGECLL